MNFKILLFIGLLFSAPAVFACVCSPRSLTDTYQTAHLVAKIKILKLTQDSTHKEYHTAAIEMINLYKGEPVTKIRISSALNSSCAFLPSINSTWIIFASIWQGELSFGMCSGSLQLNRTFDAVLYPNATKNYLRSVNLKQKVIEYLSGKNIQNPNPASLYGLNEGLKTIKGYKNLNEFAVFQVDVNSDMSVAKIKILTRFKNTKLTKAVFNSMKSDLKFVKSDHRKVIGPNRIIIFCYFHESQDDEHGFVSLIN
jgi:hypothetical protein